MCVFGGRGWGVNKPAQLLTTAAAVYVVTVSVDIVAAAHTERQGETAFILTSGALTKMSPISALTQYGWRELATRVCLQAKFGSIMTGRELVLASLFTGPPCIQFYRGTRSTLRTINVLEYLKTPNKHPPPHPVTDQDL